MIDNHAFPWSQPAVIPRNIFPTLDKKKSENQAIFPRKKANGDDALINARTCKIWISLVPDRIELRRTRKPAKIIIGQNI